MNNKFKNRVLLFFSALVLSAGVGKAQNPISLYYLENLPQNNFLNAGIMPRCNAFVGIPGISTIYTDFHLDLSAEDFFQEVNGDWHHPLSEDFDYGKLYDKMGDSFSFSMNQQISLLYFGFRLKKGYVTFSLNEKIHSRFNIAKDLFKIADLGGFPDGSSFDFSTFSTKAYAYKEFSLGYAHEINSKLTLGAHLKPLFGQVAIESKIDQFALNTGLDGWSIESEGNVYSSMPVEVEEGEDGFPDSAEAEDLEASDYISKYGTSFSNPGIAMDLGAEYKLTQAISFSAALNNLGYISWSEDLNSVSFKGNYEFDGPSITVLNMDSIGDLMEAAADSMLNVMDGKTENNSFTTALAPTLYLGAQYKLNHAVSFGVVSASIFEKENFRQNFNLSANFNLYNGFTANFNYNIDTKGTNDFGLAMGSKLGPLQLYYMIQHVTPKYRSIEIDGDEMVGPFSMQNFAFAFGVNLIFGGKGFRDKPMIDTYSEY